jgi:hypothetical protein
MSEQPKEYTDEEEDFPEEETHEWDDDYWDEDNEDYPYIDDENEPPTIEEMLDCEMT